MAGRFLTLALFVVLLSFFIVLNSMSSYEEKKAEAVSNSLSDAFTRTTATIDQSDPDMSMKSKSGLTAGTTLDKIEALFTEQISGVKIQQNRLGTIMQMRMTVKQFEQLLSKSGGIQIGGAQPSPFINTMVSLMNSRRSIPYRMDIIMETSQDPAQSYNKAPSNMAMTLRRVAGYADEIESFGLPAKLVTSGIEKGEDGLMVLIFRRYEPLNLATKSQTDKAPSNEAAQQ